MASNVIVVNILGNTRGLTNALGRAQKSIHRFQSRSNSLRTGLMSVAAAAVAAGVGIAGTMTPALGAAAVGILAVTAAVAGLGAAGLGIAALGIVFASMSEQVKTAAGALKQGFIDVMTEASKPLRAPIADILTTLLGVVQSAGGSLKTIFTELVPVVGYVNTALAGLNGTLGPALLEIFRAATPLLYGLVDGLGLIATGFMDMVRVMAPAKEQFGEFVRGLLGAIGGLLPQIGRLAVAFAPLANEFVAGIVPVFTKFTDLLINRLLPLFEQLRPAFAGLFEFIGNVFAGLGDSLPALVAGVNKFFAVLSSNGTTVRETFAVLGTAIGQLLPTVGQLLIAVLPLAQVAIPVLVQAFQALAPFLISTVIPALTSLFTWLSQNDAVVKFIVPALFAFGVAMTAIGTVLNFVMPVIRILQTVFSAIAPVITKLAPIVGRILPVALRLLGGAFTALLGPVGLVIAIIAAVGTAIYLVIKHWDTIKEFLVGVWNGIAEVAKKVWGGIKDFFGGLVSGIATVFSNAWNGITTYLSNKWNSIKNTASVIWAAVKTVIGNKIEEARSAVASKVAAVITAMANAWSQVKSGVSSAWAGIVSTVATKIAEVVTKVQSIKGRITGALSGAGSWLVSTGRNVIQGLINGIQAMASSVASRARNVVQGAINAARNALGINSPSRVFREIGVYTVQGLEAGLKKTAGVKVAARGLAKAVQDNFEAPRLSIRDRLATASASGGSNSTQFVANFYVPENVDRVEAGRMYEDSIKQWKKFNG